MAATKRGYELISSNHATAIPATWLHKALPCIEENPALFHRDYFSTISDSSFVNICSPLSRALTLFWPLIFVMRPELFYWKFWMPCGSRFPYPGCAFSMGQEFSALRLRCPSTVTCQLSWRRLHYFGKAEKILLATHSANMENNVRFTWFGGFDVAIVLNAAIWAWYCMHEFITGLLKK